MNRSMLCSVITEWPVDMLLNFTRPEHPYNNFLLHIVVKIWMNIFKHIINTLFHILWSLKVLCYSGANTSQTRTRNRNFPSGMQFSHVGYKYFRKIESRIPSYSTTFLWFVGVDNYHTCFYATSHLLQVPFYRLPLWNLEACL